jgi:FixJ family two-component response regulator
MTAGEQLPVVVVTAYDEPNSREQCLAAGAASFLLKPLDQQVILDAIVAAIESHRLRRARAS